MRILGRDLWILTSHGEKIESDEDFLSNLKQNGRIKGKKIRQFLLFAQQQKIAPLSEQKKNDIKCLSDLMYIIEMVCVKYTR